MLLLKQNLLIVLTPAGILVESCNIATEQHLCVDFHQSFTCCKIQLQIDPQLCQKSDFFSYWAAN